MKRQKQYVDHEKKRQRRVFLFSVVLIVIMLGSTFAYYMIDASSDSNRMEYGDYEFSFKDLGDGNGVLVTDINGQEVQFQTLPIQVAYLEVDPNAVSLIKSGQQVVLAADPTIDPEDAAAIDYARLQLSLAIPKTVNAMTQEDERYSLPVVNCSIASAQLPVVIFNVTNQTSVTSDGACIFVNAEKGDILRVKDRLIFEYYNILQNGSVVE